MKRHKILYGICGIGNGHTYRQLPIVSHFAQNNKIAIFAYDASYDFYYKRFSGGPNVRVIKIAVPFYVGDKNGLNFKATFASPLNKNVDFLKINCEAFVEAKKFIGKPHLVITDYEPFSAQYAYMYNAPLVTIDQQSKYLAGKFPADLGGYTFNDEIARLHMFFPRVATRIACSFFKFPLRPGGDKISLFPPTLKDEVISLKRRPSKNKSILVYITSAREYVQSLDEVISACAEQKDAEFHVFSKLHPADFKTVNSMGNIKIYKPDDALFYKMLGTCSGVVSTAGHSLLSEAMYLNIPVYAIPVSPYEQHMNANVINKYKFGISHHNIAPERLSYFLKHLSDFQKNIAQDKKILLRGIGQKEIIKFIKEEYSSEK